MGQHLFLLFKAPLTMPSWKIVLQLGNILHSSTVNSILVRKVTWCSILRDQTPKGDSLKQVVCPSKYFFLNNLFEDFFKIVFIQYRYICCKFSFLLITTHLKKKNGNSIKKGTYLEVGEIPIYFFCFLIWLIWILWRSLLRTMLVPFAISTHSLH